MAALGEPAPEHQQRLDRLRETLAHDADAQDVNGRRGKLAVRLEGAHGQQRGAAGRRRS